MEEEVKRLRGFWRCREHLVRRIPWIWRGGLALLDQGLFSGANFIISILLARWLPPEEYGTFAVAYSIFLFLASFHSAVLTEPMLVFGASKYAEGFRKYLGILIHGHWGITGIIAFMLALAAFAFWKLGPENMAQALIGLAVASPFILFFGLARRGLYVDLRARWAVAGSASYSLLAVTGIFILNRFGWLSAASAFIDLGAASLVSGVALLCILRPQLRIVQSNPTPAMILADHWGYGSWSVLTVSLHWASGQILMVLIPIFLGLRASAVVAAVLNLFRPVNLLMQSSALIILPALSAVATRGISSVELRRRVERFLFVFAGGVFLYGILMTSLAQPILHFLYKGKYDEHVLLVLLFAFSYTASAVTQVLTLVLKASANVRSTVSIWGFCAAVLVVVVIPMMRVGGIGGAVLSALASYLLAALMAWKQIKKTGVLA